MKEIQFENVLLQKIVSYNSYRMLQAAYLCTHICEHTYKNIRTGQKLSLTYCPFHLMCLCLWCHQYVTYIFCLVKFSMRVTYILLHYQGKSSGNFIKSILRVGRVKFTYIDRHNCHIMWLCVVISYYNYALFPARVRD